MPLANGSNAVGGRLSRALADVPFIDGKVITGRVVDVQQQSVFQTASGKVLALIVDGQPLQFGQQVLKTTVFVEAVGDFSDGNGLGRQRGIVLYGDINSAVRPGHIIQAVVRRKGGQLYAKRLNNLTTASSVSSSSQVTGLLALLMLALAVGIPLLFLSWLLGSIADGSLIAGLFSIVEGLLIALGPLVMMCLGAYWLIKSLFK